MIGTGQAYIPLPGQSPLEGITVSQMIANDVTVNGEAVTGTIYHLSNVPGYEDGQKEGHYFPVEFPETNFKPLHVGGDVGGDGFTAGKDFTPSAQDPYLVIRTENCTVDNSVSVYDFATKEKLFTLNFSGADLQPNPVTLSKRRTRKVAKPLTED